MQRDLVVGANALERGDHRAALGEIVLAVNLEPCDAGMARQHLRDVRRTQTDARGGRQRSVARHDVGQVIATG